MPGPTPVDRRHRLLKSWNQHFGEDEEARRVQSILHLSDAEVMEITHFERGSGLISTNSNHVTVEIKCSQTEKERITTDRRVLQELLDRSGGLFWSIG